MESRQIPKFILVASLCILATAFTTTTPAGAQATQCIAVSYASGPWSSPYIWSPNGYPTGDLPYCVPQNLSDIAYVYSPINLDINVNIQNVSVMRDIAEFAGFNGSLTLSGTSLTTGNEGVESPGFGGFGIGVSGDASISLSNGASINDLTGFLMGGIEGTTTLTIASGSVFSDASAVVEVVQGNSVSQVEVTGGSQWNNTGDLNLSGGGGSGGADLLLKIDSDGVVKDATGEMGVFGGVTSVTVDGAGSTWTSQVLTVGPGNGTLTIQNGGLVTSNGIAIAAGKGSQGLITVTGQGSKLNASGSNALIVGAGGNATLNVTSGGAVVSTTADIGHVQGGAAQVTVSGAGSSWANSGTLNIGEVAPGTLSIQSGGTVTSGNAAIADQSGSGGSSATVDGANSVWTVNGTLAVGQGDTGSLTLQNQGAVTVSDQLLVGGGSTSGQAAGAGTVLVQSGGTLTSQGAVVDSAINSNSLTVTGAESSFESTGTEEVTVGDTGYGTLTINNGATGSDGGELTLGNQAGSTGVMTVDGQGTSWDNASSITVGKSGSGTITISNGAKVSSGPENTPDASSGELGAEKGGSGGVSVSGDGSAWDQTGNFTVGGAGSGTLTISGGGEVSNEDGTVGDEASGIGTVIVKDSGSTWSNSGDLTVGNEGTGYLTVQPGGQVESVSGTVGGEAGSYGDVLITSGAWNMSGDLTVADKGKGVLNGNSAMLASASGSIGDGAGSNGNVTLGDSTWTMNGDLTVGGEGTGALNLAGATTVSNQEGTIGDEATGVGGVTVAAGSTWANSGDLTIGNEGTGTLGILDGGKVTDVAADIGSETNSHGTVTVAGLWQNSNDLTIGDKGAGTLTINGSGSVTNFEGDIGSYVGAVGQVTVEGNGTTSSIPTWHNNGALAVGDGGTGVLNILDGGQVYSESGAIGGAVGSEGTVKVDGAGSEWVANEPGDTRDIEIGTDQGKGKLTVSNGGVVKAENTEVGANGILAGVNGTLIGNVTVDQGGLVEPGDPGPMSIIGNFDLGAGSTLTLEIASATDYDSLNITGNGTFNGTIDLDFLNGFTPSAGDHFDFITDHGAFTWSPNAVEFTGITGGPSITDLTDGFGLTATSNWTGGSPPISSTPEPASVILLGTGILILLGYRRYRVARA